ncbi:MAG: hypothetical protein OHK0029_38090 [Armatimonadaceae bacterium]
MQSTSLRTLSILMSVTAVLLLLISFRLSQRGDWIPRQMPVEIGAWYAADMPLSRYTLEQLGNPPSEGRRYTNPFNERVDVQIIATSSYDAFLEPLILFAGFGYSLTAEKNMDTLGKAGKIRANVLQNVNDGSRLLLYQWIQFEDGTVLPTRSVRDLGDTFHRLQLGVESIFMGKRSCIVRAYTQIHPADTQGTQSRRNIEAISRALYDAMREQGNAAAQNPDTISGPPAPPVSSLVAGQDITYLDADLQSEVPDSKRKNLLPLTVGNTWDMESVSDGKRSRDKLVVVGQRSDQGASGVQVDILREGEKFRRDIYKKQGDTVLLVAMQDETSPLMRLDPPLPLWKEPAKLGDETRWIGEYRMNNRTYPAKGFSRISGLETVVSPAGKFNAFRVDTVIIVNQMTSDGKETRFPMVRWVAPGVGFVRRGFADKGKPAFSELTRFNIR